MVTLPLGCCDLVLGIQWLSSLGQILWDIEKLIMEFYTQGNKHVLRGLIQPDHKQINSSTMDKVLEGNRQLALIHDVDSSVSPFSPSLHHINVVDNATTPLELDLMLQKFSSIFVEPQALHPFRQGFDHHIPLQYGSNPFINRPYRYLALQKDIIESLVNDMLKTSDIK